jgi:hypothetical protein
VVISLAAIRPTRRLPRKINTRPDRGTSVNAALNDKGRINRSKKKGRDSGRPLHAKVRVGVFAQLDYFLFADDLGVIRRTHIKHVSRAMLSRYSHVRMEAKRRALDEIAARQRGADEKREQEIERQRQAAEASQSVVVL